MWYGNLHNEEFINRMLKVNADSDKEVYCTTERIKGMLTLAKNEMELPFYFNLNQLSSFLNLLQFQSMISVGVSGTWDIMFL